MENEEKKNTPTPQETAENAAKKLRDQNDLRTFGIAFMAALVALTIYHLGRLSIRKYLRSKNPPPTVRFCECKPMRPCRCGMPHKKGKRGMKKGAPKQPQQAPKPQTAKPAPAPAAPAAPAPTAPAAPAKTN